ncbi:hypothetical protein BU17DRAFT_101883 [Hysterangium stoloniferum]|nr:hypothetical protein BU17DRAFT_101883 [Hysterangium stoloniferum]
MNEPDTENPSIDPIPPVCSLLATQSNRTCHESSHPRLKPHEIEKILGKPDAVVMRESMARGKDEKHDVETRVAALHDMRLLVENIDNANSLKHLQMYPELLSLLSPEVPDAVRRQALWIIGTVVENNPDAKAEVIRYDPLPQMLSILIPECSTENRPSEQTRARAASTLVATLVQNACGVRRLRDINAWSLLNKGLQGLRHHPPYVYLAQLTSSNSSDPEVTVRSRIAFLIDQLLRQSYMAAEFPSSQIVPRRTRSNTYPSNAPPHFASVPSITTTSPTGISARATSTPMLHALQTHGIVHTLVESLTKPPHNVSPELDPIGDGYLEKAASALVTYVNSGGELAGPEKDLLKPHLDNPACRIVWGLDHAAWDSLERSIFAA